MFDHSSIKGLTFGLPKFLLSSPLIYRFSRVINKYLGSIIRISISRYSSTISFYSSSDDFNLYHRDSSPNEFSGLNIGSGFFSHPSWSCVDLPARSHVYKAVQGQVNKDFYPLNLNTQSLKDLFNQNMFDSIYSSHTLEHISRDSHQQIFSDIHYVLKDNGIFRVCVPDIASFFYALCASPSFSEDFMLLFLKESYTPLYSLICNMSPSSRYKESFRIFNLIRNLTPSQAVILLVNEYQGKTVSPDELNFPPHYHVSYPLPNYLISLAESTGLSPAL